MPGRKTVYHGKGPSHGKSAYRAGCKQYPKSPDEVFRDFAVIERLPSEKRSRKTSKSKIKTKKRQTRNSRRANR